MFGWWVVTILPGAWVTFGLRLPRFPFWLKLLLGLCISPVVVCIQFYALRSVGISFGSVVPVTVLINLPALYLIYLRRENASIPDRKILLGAAAVLILPLALLLPQLLDSQIRVFTGHTWMQSDIVYMLADGHLRLYEPELAGIRMDYPWVAHPYHAVLSYLINSAPATSFIWTNLIILICAFGITAYTVAELGGDRFSQITAFVWVCFGLNFAGYIIFVMVPGAAHGTFWEHGPYNYAWIGGDYRITPWLLKFYFFEQSIIGQCLMAGAVYVLIRIRATIFTLDALLLLFVLLLGVGVVYSVYFAPAAVAVVLAAVMIFMDKSRSDQRERIRQCLQLGTVLALSAVLTYAFVKFVSVDRTTPPIILPAFTINFAKYAILKSASSFFVLFLFLAGLAVAFRRCWKLNPDATIIVAGCGLSSAALYVLLEIPTPSAEYKFLLSAGLSLAPFSALALQPYFAVRKNLRLPVFSAVALLLMLPWIHKLYTDFPWTPPWPHVAADASNFELRLPPDEPLAPLCEAIRQQTPEDTILVMEKTEVHFPTLTHRRLYAPPLQDLPRAGVFIISSLLLGNQKGYGKEIISDRRAVVKELFNASDDAARSRAIGEIAKQQAPIAVVTELPQHSALRSWLQADPKNTVLFDDGVRTLWLVDPNVNLAADK